MGLGRPDRSPRRCLQNQCRQPRRGRPQQPYFPHPRLLGTRARVDETGRLPDPSVRPQRRSAATSPKRARKAPPCSCVRPCLARPGATVASRGAPTAIRSGRRRWRAKPERPSSIFTSGSRSATRRWVSLKWIRSSPTSTRTPADTSAGQRSPYRGKCTRGMR